MAVPSVAARHPARPLTVFTKDPARIRQELVARRLAATTKPALDDIIAKLEVVLAGIEELKGKPLLIEQHYRSPPEMICGSWNVISRRYYRIHGQVLQAI
jgi:hypothetical protein